MTKGSCLRNYTRFFSLRFTYWRALDTLVSMVNQELNYERSVTNEIACLRILSHPGIARLISAFRWRDGAYLVLEYASRGDLHSHIKEHGSLSEESTRLYS